MKKEKLRMKMLSGIISESVYRKLNEGDEEETFLTNEEQMILNNLSVEQKEFFDDHFGKIDSGLWVTDLKHYEEEYDIDEAITICQSFNWEL